MKKVVKTALVVVGLFFIVCGLDLLKESVGAAVCGIVIGAVALLFAVKIKSPKKRKVAHAAEKEAAPALQASEQAKPAIKRMIVCPQSVDGHPLIYNYNLDLVPADGVDVVRDVLVDEEKIADVRPGDGCVEIVFNGDVIGTAGTPDRARMVGDFQRGGFPVNAIIRQDGGHVSLRFYKDRRVGQERREQTVVKLVGYAGRDAQEEIELLGIGDPLDVDDTLSIVLYGEDDSDRIPVAYQETVIGYLPKSVAVRMESETPYGVWMEKKEVSESDTGEDLLIPYVRIYW